MTVIGGIVLLASLALWAGLTGNLLTLSASDPAGRGLAEAYAFFIAIALWALLGILLLIAGVRGQMPSSAKAAAMLLYPLSGAAVLAALVLLQHQPPGVQRWPLIIPIAIPLLIMAYAVWALLPGFRASVTPGTAGLVAGGAVLLLSLAPWPQVLARAKAGSAARAGLSRAERAEQQAAFEKLTADSPLAEWRPFTDAANPLRERAFQGIRGSARRQADAEAMIAQGYSFPMLELPNLGLEPSAALCRSAGEFLVHEADFFRANNATPTQFLVAGTRIRSYLPAMEWLVSRRCDIGESLSAIEAAMREFPEVTSPEHAHFLAAIVRLRASRP